MTKTADILQMVLKLLFYGLGAFLLVNVFLWIKAGLDKSGGFLSDTSTRVLGQSDSEEYYHELKHFSQRPALTSYEVKDWVNTLISHVSGVNFYYYPKITNAFLKFSYDEKEMAYRWWYRLDMKPHSIAKYLEGEYHGGMYTSAIQEMYAFENTLYEGLNWWDRQALEIFGGRKPRIEIE